MTTRKLRLLLAALLAGVLSAQMASAQQPTTAELKKDIESLKETLKAIQKDIQEVKTLLQGRLQPPGPPPSVVLDLGNRPFKGERTAKLTLVEFSDYQ